MWAFAGTQGWLALLTMVPAPRSSLGTAAALTCVSLVALAVLTLSLLHRLPGAAVDADLALTALVVLVFVGVEANPQVSVLMGTGLILLGTVAALLLPPGRLGAHVGIYSAGFLIAATTDAVLGSALTALALVVCLAAVCALVAATRHRSSSAERRLADTALRDPVTGTLSSQATAAEADLLHAMALRRETALTAVLIHFDYLATYDDFHGRDAAESLLRDVAVAWRDVLRAGDVLGRVGVADFLLLLPDTDVYRAGALLTRMREAHRATWLSAASQWRTQETYNDLLGRITKDLHRRRRARSLR